MRALISRRLREKADDENFYVTETKPATVFGETFGEMCFRRKVPFIFVRKTKITGSGCYAAILSIYYEIS